MNLEQTVMEANQAISQANKRVIKIKEVRRKKEDLDRRIFNLLAKKEEINKTFITEPNEILGMVGNAQKNRLIDGIKNKTKMLNREKEAYNKIIQ